MSWFTGTGVMTPRPLVAVSGSRGLQLVILIARQPGFQLDVLVTSLSIWRTNWKQMIHIMQTYPCNEYPLIPHYYIVKMGFRQYIFFSLISFQNIDCGSSLEIRPNLIGINGNSIFSQIGKVNILDFFCYKLRIFQVNWDFFSQSEKIWYQKPDSILYREKALHCIWK